MREKNGRKMENKHLSSSQPTVHLTNLPPPPPSPASATGTGTGTDQANPSSEEAVTKLARKFDDEANTVADLLLDKMLLQQNNDVETQIHHPKSGQGNGGVTEKSKLHKICAFYKWKPAFFECCKQEGPPHLRLFSFKVTVEINVGGGEDVEMCLECFGVPKPKKVAAAEHAAEGALWYLKHSGYLSINKLDKKRKKKMIT